MKYKYFTKCIGVSELDSELEAFGEQGWKLIQIFKGEYSPNFLAIFIQEDIEPHPSNP